MHPRTDRRRNSGQRELADRTTGMDAKAGMSAGEGMWEHPEEGTKYYDTAVTE